MRLDLETLVVESFELGAYAHWGPCTGCGAYELLDEDEACPHCLFLPGSCPQLCEGAPLPPTVELAKKTSDG